MIGPLGASMLVGMPESGEVFVVPRGDRPPSWSAGGGNPGAEQSRLAVAWPYGGAGVSTRKFLHRLSGPWSSAASAGTWTLSPAG